MRDRPAPEEQDPIAATVAAKRDGAVAIEAGGSPAGRPGDRHPAEPV